MYFSDFPHFTDSELRQESGGGGEFKYDIFDIL
jgi:hypothetical protein